MKIVVVGASLAGWKTAVALRASGSDDEILVVGDEARPAYDRPPLSKAVLTDALAFDQIALASPEEEADLDVRKVLGRGAVSLDVRRQRIQLDDGEEFTYDAAVIATGARPRRFPWPDVDGVCYLRTYDDAMALRARFVARPRVVIVGGGFIGAEVAAAARHFDLDVTILEALPAPLSRVLGPDVGATLGRLQTDHGVTARFGVSVTGVEGTERVRGVRLADGQFVPADLVVVGIGAVPNTSWLNSSGLTLDDGVVCDEYCRATGTDNVYAVGDVARWHNPFYGESMRVEHWTNATEQAASVAQAITGQAQPYRHIPYVWSHQYGRKIQLIGRVSPGHKPTVVTSGGRFVAVYGAEDTLTAAVTLDMPRLMPRIRRLIAANATVDEALSLAYSAA
jgi:phthalate 3,4-dioxygenase ferredoxin reductase subunit